MFIVDTYGMLVDSRIIAARRTAIERDRINVIHGIVVHQTGAGNAHSTLESYKKAGAGGAHFLIDKDGACYQTASLFRQTWHVGRLKSRCVVTHRCSPAELQSLRTFDPQAEHQREMMKSYPFRFPSNHDSIGIELVGALISGDDIYESVTPQQNRALRWMITGLGGLLKVPFSEVFRHPEISRKNPSEAGTAKW